MTPATAAPPKTSRAKLYKRLGIALVLAILMVLFVTEQFPGSWRVHLFVREQRAAARMAGFVRDAPKVPAGSVVFLGSSTFQRFPFEDTYPGRPWVDRGMGSETAMDLLMRVEKSMPVAQPAGVVILVGANDTRGEGIPVACTLVLVDAMLRMFAARYPGVPVVFLQVMPVLNDSDAVLERLRILNAGIEKLALEHGQSFLRTQRLPLVDETGHSVPAMYADNHHLNAAGYKVYAKWIADGGGAATAPLRDP